MRSSSSAYTSASATRSKTPEPFGGCASAGRADLRRPAPRRAAAALRLPPRARRRARVVGGAEGRAAERRRARAGRPRRGSPARLRDASRARSRRASTAPARSRSGISGTYELSRRSATAVSPCGSHGKRLDGRLDARARAPRRQGAELAADPQARRGDARAPRTRTSLPADARDADRASCRRRGLALRGEVGRLPRARLRPRRRVPARLAERQRPDRALRAGREGAREGGAGRRTPCSTARSARSTTQGRPSFSALQDGIGRARLLRVRRARGRRRAARRAAAARSGRRGCAKLLDRRSRDGPSLRARSTTARRCSRRRRSRGSRA